MWTKVTKYRPVIGYTTRQDGACSRARSSSTRKCVLAKISWIVFKQVIPDPRNRSKRCCQSWPSRILAAIQRIQLNGKGRMSLNYAEKSTEILLNLGSEKSTFVGNITVKTYEEVLFDLCSLEENSTLSTPSGRIVRLSPN